MVTIYLKYYPVNHILSKGLEDESRWFVCHKGFKSRCDNIMYESFTDLGFERLDTHEDLRTDSASIHKLWTRSRNTKHALIRGKYLLVLGGS